MLRYADGPTAEVSIEIAAPPETVWTLVTDVNLPAQFSDEFAGAEWLDGAGPGLRARFQGRNVHPSGSRWETTCTVTWFEANRSFGYVVNDVDDPAARWRFDLDPIDMGTRLTMWAQMGPGRSGVSYFIHKQPDREQQIIEHRLDEWRGNMEATVAGIKALAESDND